MELKNRFDAVIGSSILHQLEIKPALLRIFSLLKPGGYFSFAESNMLNPQVFLERTFSFLPIYWYVSPDETALIRWKLSSLLASIGFEKIEVKPFDWLHPATPQKLIPAIKSFGRLFENIPLIREFPGSLHIKCQRPLE